ncbi:MAG: DNA polymerase III subunit delta' [Firmicutes bacterium ZCTH02-B6]|mgnify:CR=1 FL=1|nr:MAG: DNA polymerase III subunit delta' [Firmicutes bacterium ZCTH02-B6]
MSWENVRGQAAAVKMLRGTLASGRAAHAYLFTGPRGVGKTTAALVFAAGLLCREPAAGEPCGRCESCREVMGLRHPDVHRVEPDGDVIRIEQVRQVQRQAALRPVIGPYQVFFIEPAEAAGEAAQNALLKVLEEPPGSTVFVLITHQTAPLLPTVVSRCVPVRFGRLPRDVAADILRERFGYGDAAELGAALGDGSIWQATRWTPQALKERRATAVALWDALTAGPSAALEQAQAWHDRRDELLEILEMLELWLRDMLVCREQPHGASADPSWLVNVDQRDELVRRAQRLRPAALLGALDAILAFRRQVQQNVSLRTAADVLLLDLCTQAAAAQKG